MKKRTILFTMAAFFGLLCTAQAQSPCDDVNSPLNLMTNGSFEDDVNGWNWNGGLMEIGSDFAICGTNNASFSFAGGNPAFAWQEITGIPDGTSLTLKCSLGTFELGQTCSPQVHLSFYSSNRVLISSVSKDITNNVELPPHLLSPYNITTIVPVGTVFTCVEITTQCDRVKMDDFSLFANSLVLPVRLSQFSGTLQNGISLLNWTTASEENISNFNVEHSENGSSFSGIGTVNSRGNSSTPVPYQFEHAFLQPGKNYYRLKITDRNGLFTYSSIVVVDASTTVLSQIRIAPNPFAGKLEFRFYSTEQQRLLVRLVNHQGKIVLVEKYAAPKGANLFTLKNLDKLPAGIYMAEVVTDAGLRLLTRKLVK